jgi:hypothetical protein
MNLQMSSTCSEVILQSCSSTFDRAIERNHYCVDNFPTSVRSNQQAPANFKGADYFDFFPLDYYYVRQQQMLCSIFRPVRISTEDMPTAPCRQAIPNHSASLRPFHTSAASYSAMGLGYFEHACDRFRMQEKVGNGRRAANS